MLRREKEERIFFPWGREEGILRVGPTGRVPGAFNRGHATCTKS